MHGGAECIWMKSNWDRIGLSNECVEGTLFKDVCPRAHPGEIKWIESKFIHLTVSSTLQWQTDVETPMSQDCRTALIVLYPKTALKLCVVSVFLFFPLDNFCHFLVYIFSRRHTDTWCESFRMLPCVTLRMADAPTQLFEKIFDKKNNL